MADTAAAIAKLKKQSDGVRDPIILACVNHLIAFLDQEPSFAEKIMNEKKTLKEMRNYIYSEARKLASGNCAAVEDTTVFGWAVHYFDEADLKASETVSAKVTTGKAPKNKAKPEPVVVEKPVKKAEKKAKKQKPEMMNIFDFLEG